MRFLGRGGKGRTVGGVVGAVGGENYLRGDRKEGRSISNRATPIDNPCDNVWDEVEPVKCSNSSDGWSVPYGTPNPHYHPALLSSN